MLLLKRKTFEVESGSALVAADEAAAVASAEAVAEAAEAEAAAVREEARRAYEAEKARGYADGVREGKAEIMMQKLNLLDESVRYMESVENKMADVVMKALRKCVAETDDRELAVRIVRKAMQAVVRTQRQIAVRVNPAMKAEVKARMEGLMKEFPTLAYVDVAEDAHLSATACVVETEAGIVEASVEGQIEAIEKSIRSSFAKGK